ncbi:MULTISPECIES: N-6 DNA methylase [Enterococcus]|uniref:site-specific DNA-methyltransferase (adenine-specific) n=1 Tax=Enterococcus ratti TaxID=150033 RepID=A0A1L8WRM2_9ENTE|nr:MULTISPECIES: N-6 DNA methylase [Enterococcus]MCR1912958.1 N-6 DNA methylase [Enterococcus hirae]OJG83677.1 restriction enzyme BgcI subunit alpha [Enterococcus ratti]QKX72527.1 N-6 DNA methylase [Enterococcus hirae]QQU13035.1 N-6 DNA methylase [Enterococcus hirae]
MATNKSVERDVEDLVNSWLKSYGLKYYLQNSSVNPEIDKALLKSPSKLGGLGGNYPDVKLLLQDSKLDYYPIVIEYKGTKDALVKLDKDGHIANIKTSGKDNGLPNYQNIARFAVNGAVHYANAILQYSSYTDVIAIGITGYIDDYQKLQLQIGVYFVSKKNYGIGQRVGDFTDLSFLKKENFDGFIGKIEQLSLSSEELSIIHQKREDSIEDALTRINEKLYNQTKNISALSRIHLVASSIMANLGVPHKVTPLEPEDLKSSTELGETDGEIVLRKIKSFLMHKGLPVKKQHQIINSLSITLNDESYSAPINGESLIKDIFSEVVDTLGMFYKVGVDTDFTGKLFNVMFRWLNFAGDDQNDVVLTPRYVANLMAKLARVNKNSYVWDFATGSGGLLVAAMNLMIEDAKNTINSPEELSIKIENIRDRQILGIEILPEIYILAVLNMILMGDGSSNIIQKNSLTEFTGQYEYGVPENNRDFPADAFLLNPPYSESGNGMNFVEKALSMMTKGYACVIIQDSAGSGKAVDYNKNILKNNTLLASIKMPPDIFIGKSNVPTCIYVFRVGERHEKDSQVTFIDFTNDGYKRKNRRKAKASSNLKNVDNAIERYEEVVNIVKYGINKKVLLKDEEVVVDTISLDDEKIGSDWNFGQHVKKELVENIDDIQKSVFDYISWEIRRKLVAENNTLTSDIVYKLQALEEKYQVVWKESKISEFFNVRNNPSLNKNELIINPYGQYPYFTRTINNNGISDYSDYVDEEHKIMGNTIAVGLMAMEFFYLEKDYYTGQFTKSIVPKFENFERNIGLYFISLFNQNKTYYKGSLVRDFDKIFLNTIIHVPMTKGEIARDYINEYVKILEKFKVQGIKDFIDNI